MIKRVYLRFVSSLKNYYFELDKKAKQKSERKKLEKMAWSYIRGAKDLADSNPPIGHQQYLKAKSLSDKLNDPEIIREVTNLYFKYIGKQY